MQHDLTRSLPKLDRREFTSKRSRLTPIGVPRAHSGHGSLKPAARRPQLATGVAPGHDEERSRLLVSRSNGHGPYRPARPPRSPVAVPRERVFATAARSGTWTTSSTAFGSRISGRLLDPSPGMCRRPGGRPNVTEPSVHRVIIAHGRRVAQPADAGRDGPLRRRRPDPQLAGRRRPARGSGARPPFARRCRQ